MDEASYFLGDLSVCPSHNEGPALVEFNLEPTNPHSYKLIGRPTAKVWPGLGRSGL